MSPLNTNNKQFKNQQPYEYLIYNPPNLFAEASV